MERINFMKCHCCTDEYEKIYENTYKCVGCSHIYRLYHGNSIDYHKNQYRKQEDQGSKEIDSNGNITPIFHQKRQKICENRVNAIKDFLDSSCDCLDIGAGSGTFAKCVKKEVKSIECTELDPSLVESCKTLGFNTYQEDFLTLKIEKKYDIVFAWHVLEHVDNVDLFLKKINNLTSRYCIIEIPLLVSLSGEGRKRKLTDPTFENYDGHAHYFSKESFETISSKYFNILEIREGIQSPALLAVLEKKNENI